jgi:hypothetical protein
LRRATAGAQFPDEAAFKDSILVGLIGVAISLPFIYLIGAWSA